MWGPILEKAFAKLHGNYQHIVEGDVREAAMTLTGSPSLVQLHEQFDMEDIWNELIMHEKNNEMIFLNTAVFPNDAKINACGLMSGHTYVVLSAKEISNGARLV